MGPQEHKVERRLAAIFAADVAGYSRLMEQDEVGTLRTLTAYREIMDRLIVEHGGRIANTAGETVSLRSSPVLSMPSGVPSPCRRRLPRMVATCLSTAASSSGLGCMLGM